MKSFANFARCLGSKRPKRVLALSPLCESNPSELRLLVEKLDKSGIPPAFENKLFEEAFSYVVSSSHVFWKKVFPFWNTSHKAKPYAHMSHLGRSAGSIGDKS
jgi:hypothetical protein